uniref:DNA packaging tegument protein UL25 n=1 Tax=Mastomys natalensis cytomegalovirus 1 TaxID=2973541 RepID=A0A9Y1IJI8_9BETA|nr:DNA packaging tegument protein UL25 [Mastomys natalensis cytomegalovirus 1]WEG68935.1 DNA packaging tegument protein UL25 [Mastomys natalensis cytomegalovirus 1]WEG71163.1 DNA packaging tegument protein UL25 [Mastomys natalensis cytomegalovirus 1]
MNPLRTFHGLPCVLAYEAHPENVLVCPRDVLLKLRDESALRMRQRMDDMAHDTRLRRRAGEELEVLGEEVRAECKKFRDRIGEAEKLLAEPMAVFPDTAAVDKSGGVPEGSSDDALHAVKRKDGDGTRFWIAPNDPPISFVSDFRAELVDTMFNITQTWSFSFGSWYYRLKRWLFNQPRWRRVYRLTYIESMAVSQELLMGVLNAVEQVTVYPAHDNVLSDLEAAVCIMAAYQSALEPKSEMPTTVEGILLDSPRILKHLADDLTAEVPPKSGNSFGFKDEAGLRFYAPLKWGRRYSDGTFDEHALVAVLFRRGALSHLPGSTRVTMRETMERISGAAHDNLLMVWTLRLFGKRLGNLVPIFTMEQHYLRSGLTAVVSLLLLWKVLNSESVFSGRAGKFSLKDIFPDGFGGECINLENEEGFSGSYAKNYEFLIERYVVPWYERNSAVTMSQLWPGLMLLAYCESRRSGWDLNRRITDPSDGSASAGLQVQSSRVNPLVDYMMLQTTAAAEKDADRLAAHDYALFHCENGLGRLLSYTLPKHRMLTLGTQFFNVQSIYDCIYFCVLGFLPVINVT